MKNLTVVIIAKDEEAMIGDAIKSVKWAKNVLVLDTGSVDRTANIAFSLGAKVKKLSGGKLTFAAWRTQALDLVKTDWIFYLDADERCTPALAKEITRVIKSVNFGIRFGKETITAYAIPRQNFYLGKRFYYGGSWPDYVKRLYFRPALKKWIGALHEEPVFIGKLGLLKEPMQHFSHRDLTSMLVKTTAWSQLEAENLWQHYPGGHPPVTWWRLLHVMLKEVWDRGIKKQGFRDGTAGVIEVIFQAFSRFITYARLWEKQKSTHS